MRIYRSVEAILEQIQQQDNDFATSGVRMSRSGDIWVYIQCIYKPDIINQKCESKRIKINGVYTNRAVYINPVFKGGENG